MFIVTFYSMERMKTNRGLRKIRNLSPSNFSEISIVYP